jgi:DNA invertase Pin-like site-specific DNA recombinase
MAAKRDIGVSYTRFSDPGKQSRGDSQDRQDKDFRSFCARHNLTALPEVYADRGRSGYKDEHRKKGRLGQLIAAAKEGRFEPRTVIVVEAWDRLGRLRPDKQTALVAELLQTGVRIGVCKLDDIFSEDDFGTHKWTTLAVFIQLAYQESKQKAERVASSWASRRERARQKGSLTTGRLPAWLEVVNGEARLIPERAAVVKKIFQLAGEGHGRGSIVRQLVQDKVPAFGEVVVREGRRRSQFSGKWSSTYVKKILNDKRAMGVYQPKLVNGTEDGSPIRDYFPAVISEAEFVLAREGQGRRYVKRGSPKHSRYVNVFRGLLTHARDGGYVGLNNRGTTTRPQLILVTDQVEGTGGPVWTFPYVVFEEAVLGKLREVKAKDVFPDVQAEASRADVVRARLANIRADIGALHADLKGGYSKTLAALLREKEAEEEQAAGELQDELIKTVRPAAQAWDELPGLVDLIRQAEDPDAARLKLRAVLARTVTESRVLFVRRGSYLLAAAQFFFEGGKRRDYLVAYQSAAFGRTGGWEAGSLKEKLGLDDDSLDLRRPDHAARLEAALLKLDLAGLGAGRVPAT